MTNHTPPRNICVVGNIASGKSTLCALLGAAIDNSIAIPEEFTDNPFLPLYAANRERWAFTNAVRYFYDYARVYAKLTAGHNYIHCFIDAGGASNREVYGRYLADTQLVTPAEDAFHGLLCDLIAQTLAYPDPDAYIFLHAAPETCFDRMQKRAWDYQTDHLPLDYLVALDPYFHSFQNKIAAGSVPYLELDSAAINFTDTAKRQEIVERVRAFLDGS